MKKIIGLVVALFLGVSMAWAVPTKVVVGVKARDAKFIGTSMGGVLVLIQDACTGEILAKGVAQGSTGDTKLLMKTPKERYTKLIVGKTAKFVANLDLKEPRKVRIVARGPLAQPQAMQEVSVTTWLVPGKPIEELVLEMPGLVVDVLSPSAHTMVKGPAEVELRASVTPMCGCPVDPRFFWKPENYEVAALVKKGGQYWKTVPLAFTGKTNHFAAKLQLEKGVYEFIVYAYDRLTGNTGLDRTTLIVK